MSALLSVDDDLCLSLAKKCSLEDGIVVQQPLFTLPSGNLKEKKIKKIKSERKSVKCVKSVKSVKEKVLNSAISVLDKQFDELNRVLAQIQTSRVLQTDEFVLELLRDKEVFVKAKLASVKIKLQGKKTSLTHI